MDNARRRSQERPTEKSLGDRPALESIAELAMKRVAVMERIRDIVFVRESDPGKKGMMLGMAQQTLQLHLTALPHLQPLFDSGLEPIEHPSKWGAETRSATGWRSYVVQVGSTLVVYYLGTAAVKSEQGDYEFARFAIELIRKYRPSTVRCGPMSRLIREKVPASLLFDAMRDCGVQLIVGDGATIDPRTAEGEMQWQIHTIFATNERRMIMNRLLLGKIAAAGRNVNPFSDHAVPPGYQKVDKTLEPDPEMVPAIRETLLLMADPERSARELAQLLGRHGMSRLRIKKHHGDDATTSDLVEPKDLRQALLRWLHLYETGTYVQRHGIQILGISQIGPLPVLRDERHPDGYIELSYTWGVPSGGWASPEVFAAIRASEEVRRKGRTTNSRTTRRPFTHLPTWQFNGFEWRLATNDSAAYVLERRVASNDEFDDEQEELATPSTNTWEVVGRISNIDLGRAVHRAAVRVFSEADGTPIELRAPSVLPVALASRRHEELERIRTQIASLRVQADRARRRSSRIDDDATAALLLADAAVFCTDADRLEASLGDLATTQALPMPATLELDVGAIVAVLATVAQARGALPREASDVVASSFVDFSIVHTDGSPEAILRFHLEVPIGDGGVALLGPITGSVSIFGRHLSSRSSTPKERRQRDILARLSEGDSQEEIVSALRDISALTLRRYLVDAAMDVGIPSRTAWIVFSSPIPEMHCLFARLIRLGDIEPCRSLLLDDLEAWAAENLLCPDDVDPKWVALTLSRYLRSEPRSKLWSSKNVVQLKAIRALEAHGGKAMLTVLRKSHPEFDDQNFRGYIFNGRSEWQPVLRAEKVQTDQPKVHGGFRSDTLASIIPCPHCGGHANVPLCAVEVPTSLLCPVCHRSSDVDSPVYPNSYFDLPTQITRGNVLGPPSSISPSVAANKARVGAQIANPSKGPRRSVADVDPRTRQAICDAYAKSTASIVGPDGICETYDVTPKLLYRILDASGVERRFSRVNRHPKP